VDREKVIFYYWEITGGRGERSRDNKEKKKSTAHQAVAQLGRTEGLLKRAHG